MTWVMLHERVIDGDDIVVDGNAGGGSAGGADEHRIADRVGGELDLAADDVVEAQRTVGNEQSHSEVFA
jgi:hypothetical protein